MLNKNTGARPYIIILVDGMKPTEGDFEMQELLSTGRRQVVFRNRQQIQDEDAPEPCDGIHCGELQDPDFKGGVCSIPAGYSEIPIAKPLKATAARKAEAGLDPAVVAQRASDDDGAKGATVAQLKEALDALKIPYGAQQPKAELLALYLARP